MLPNWLYGKSKSKLAELLGGGGTPSDYNEVKAQVTQNAEDILLLSDDLDGKAAKTQISNPNILINPWFTVNQRAFTTTASASNTYVADRWKVLSASGITITNGEGGITIDNTNGSTYVTMETLLPPNASKSLLGREVTMSLSKVIGATYLYKTFTMPESLPPSSTVIDTVAAEDCTLRTVITGNGYVKVDVQVKEGKSVTIRAIKLEIGAVSTLALDPRPEYATELAKCQRYFQRISGDANSIIDWGFSTSGNIVRYCIHIKEMRTKPTMTYRNVKCGDAAPSSFTLASYTSGRVQVNASVSSASTANVNYRLLLGSDGYIDFDAEL